MVGPAHTWGAHLARCRALGFDHVAIPPPFAPGASGDVFLAGDLELAHPLLVEAADGCPGLEVAITKLAAAYAAHGLALLVDVVLDRVHVGGRVALDHPELFAITNALPDPRTSRLPCNVAVARFDQPDAAKRLVALWSDRLQGLLKAGVAGFRFLYPQSLTAGLWCSLVGALRSASPEAVLLVWTPGMSRPDLSNLGEVEFDDVFSSIPWWDRRATWFAEELNTLRRVAPIIACPEAPFGPRLASQLSPTDDLKAAYQQALRIAAATGDGLMIPMGFEHGLRQPMDARRSTPENFEALPGAKLDLAEDIQAANISVEQVRGLAISGETRQFADQHSPVTELIRLDAPDARQAQRAAVVLINPSLSRSQQVEIALDPISPVAGGAFGSATNIDRTQEPAGVLEPGEVRMVEVKRMAMVVPRPQPAQAARELACALKAPRIVIEGVRPALDGGRFAAKRVTGEQILVEADIYSDGHGVVSADLLWKADDDRDWRRVPMRAGDNDRWQAAFASGRVGLHVFAIEAWADEYATACRDLDIKCRAGLDVSLEIAEMRNLIEAVSADSDNVTLSSVLDRLASANQSQAAETLLASDTTQAMRQTAVRHHRRREPPFRIEVERHSPPGTNFFRARHHRSRASTEHSATSSPGCLTFGPWALTCFICHPSIRSAAPIERDETTV